MHLGHALATVWKGGGRRPAERWGSSSPPQAPPILSRLTVFHVRSGYVIGAEAFTLAVCTDGSDTRERLGEVGVERRAEEGVDSLELAGRPAVKLRTVPVAHENDGHGDQEPRRNNCEEHNCAGNVSLGGSAFSVPSQTAPSPREREECRRRRGPTQSFPPTFASHQRAYCR